MNNRFTIKILSIAALLIAGSTQVSADKLWQKVVSADGINTDDIFAIGQTDGDYVLKGSSSSNVAASNSSKTNLINNYLLTTNTHEPDEIKLIPVSGKSNTYLLQFTSGEYLRGGTKSSKDLNRTTNSGDSRVEWQIVSNSNGVQIKNVETSLCIYNSSSKFTCNSNNSNSCLYKKVSEDGDLIITKRLDSYSSFVTLTSTDYDFTDTKNLKVYIVTDANKQKVTLKEVKQVPLGTPVILYGDMNHYIARKLSRGTVEKLNDNLLKVGSKSVVGDASTIYGIAAKNGKVGFYRVNTGVEFPAGSVYLVIKDTGAKDFYAFGEEATTGINGITDDGSCLKDDNWYNLNGMRVDAPSGKGIYIRNGRKVIVK